MKIALCSDLHLEFQDINIQNTENANVLILSGSKGQVYSIDTENKTCDCMGFQFRATCKHLQLINNAQ